MQGTQGTSQSAGKGRVFYGELESLRGCAALAVSLCHVFNSAQRVGQSYASFSANDWAHYVLTSLCSSEGGVAIFFVLSGFVLSLQLGDAVEPRSYAGYVIRRIFRIMPAAWASVFFAYVLLRIVHHQHPNWEEISQGLFLYEAYGVPINPPLWSLSVEMAISACLPMMVAANARLSPTFQVALLLAFVWLSTIYGQPHFVQYLFAFQLGIMVPSGAAAIAKLDRRVACALFAPALLAVMSATNLHWQGLISERTQVMIEVFGAFYVVAFVRANKSVRLTGWLNAGPARFLGRVSYSLYVLNYPLLGTFWVAFGLRQPFSLWSMLAAAAVFIPINLAAAALSYRLFEAPFVRWGKQAAEAWAAWSTGARRARQSVSDAPLSIGQPSTAQS